MTLVERIYDEAEQYNEAGIADTADLLVESAERIQELEARYEKSQDQIDRMVEENAALREELSKANEAHWFYLGDDCSSEQCRFCIDECISEDFEWDNPQVGEHILQISGARPVPDMWIALRYFTEAEMDERDDDEPYTYTVHATYDEAKEALGEKA